VVAKFENIKLERANAEASAAQAAVGSAKSRVEAALDNHRRVQKRLKESRVELERVITVRLCELNPILKALAFNHLNLKPYTVQSNVMIWFQAYAFTFHWRQYTTEHDETVQAGKSEEVTRITISVIHDNEAKVAALVQTAAAASEELADAKARTI
jgi:hypothetical protein